MPQSVRRSSSPESWVGKKSGRWLITAVAGKSRHGKPQVEVICECGAIKVIDLASIKRGISNGCPSCGNTTHGHSKGHDQSSEYMAWNAARKRCHNPKTRHYDYYGGRGVIMSDKWRWNFEAFLADVGLKPTPAHTLDRHPDPFGNYEPGNVRWATRSEQQRNRRDNFKRWL